MASSAINVLRARTAAYKRAALYDGRQVTERARQAADDRFLMQVDPTLPEPERLRRAEALRRSWYAGIQLKSALVRRASQRKTAEQLEEVR